MRGAAGAGDDYLETGGFRALGEGVEAVGGPMCGNDARVVADSGTSSVSAACFMVCQSDWLPMMIATDFASGGATTILCAKEAPDYR